MKRIAAVAATTVAAITLATGCGWDGNPAPVQDPNQSTAGTTDPKQGWVQIWNEPDPNIHNTYYMRCQGSNLIIETADHRGGAMFSPNDQLCAAKK